MTIRLQTKNLAPWVDDSVLTAMAPQVAAASELLRTGKGPGNDFIGWLDPSKVVSAPDLASIKEAAKRIQDQSEVLVTVGIGGSYLGARAVLRKPFTLAEMLEAVRQALDPRITQ